MKRVIILAIFATTVNCFSAKLSSNNFNQPNDFGEEQDNFNELGLFENKKILEHQDSFPTMRVNINVGLRMTDKALKTVREIVIPLEDSYLPITNMNMDVKGERFNQFLLKNPNVTIVLDCGKATEIKDNCLAYLSNMKKIRIEGENIKTIGNNFLGGCSGLTELDLTPLSQVEEIGELFLCGCSALTELDLMPLRNITKIRKSFLFGCKSLTELDLTAFRYVSAIGDDFLSWCTGLTTLDLTPLRHITQIGDNFLSGCRGLIELDLKALRYVSTIGRLFLAHCSGLRTLDLTPLNNVIEVNDHLLFNCTGLMQVQIVPDWKHKNKLPKVKRVVEVMPERAKFVEEKSDSYQRAPGTFASAEYDKSRTVMQGILIE